jgi:DNA invertase Pin-like site-specific DNA recombinase
VNLAEKITIEGYVDQPAISKPGCADAERLKAAGVLRIHYETDLETRPVLCQLTAIDDSERALVVVALDRLGGPLSHLVGCLTRLRAVGVCITSIDDGINLDLTPEGRAQRRFIDAISKCAEGWKASREQTRRKTMAERGVRPGAQSKLDTSSSEQIRSMLGRPGATRESVARELGVGRTTLYRFLRRSLSSSDKTTNSRL